MKNRVAILGGGVAGMSAAHELADRGFKVQVYEYREVPGGKARSVPVPGSGKSGRRDLPGEHGFRFFPGFYRHLPDTMKRIPYRSNRRGVFDNLVPTSRIEFARPGYPPLILLPRLPHSLSDLRMLFSGFSLARSEFGVTLDDLEFFSERLWQILTSCEERRLDEYERTGWWYFVRAEERSKAYQDLLGVGLTRSLVAAQAKRASTKTVGDIGLQLIFNLLEPGVNSDRVLNGPTNDVWIQPWLEYLERRGVEYHRGVRVEALHCQGRTIREATVSKNGRTYNVEADYYIAAMPLEVMGALLTPKMLAADPILEGMQKLIAQNALAWMNGIQFYLKEDVPLVHGHQIFLDSPWALTSLSQAQFWPGFDLRDYGDGTVRGIISVDISDWEAEGINQKCADDCTHEEIAEEVWAQLKQGLNTAGAEVLRDDMRHSWFVDPDIVAGDYPPHKETNLEPLLVNLAGTWDLRPNAHTGISNLFLASDYVRTHTDLATMEGANEAARRAVNCVIDEAGARASYCRVWRLHEPDLLAPWRAEDRIRYRKGLPWDGKLLDLRPTASDSGLMALVDRMFPPRAERSARR